MRVGVSRKTSLNSSDFGIVRFIPINIISFP